MKRLLLSFLIMIGLTSTAMAETRHLGNYSYIDTDHPLLIAVNASVAAKHTSKGYLPLVAYIGGDHGVTATLNHASFTLIYKGQEIPLPSLKELRTDYNQDVMDLTILSKETEHVFPSEMSRFDYQKRVDFFPARNQSFVAAEEATVNWKQGLRTKLYFKNPGIEKGDTAILQIVPEGKPDLTSKIEIKF